MYEGLYWEASRDRPREAHLCADAETQCPQLRARSGSRNLKSTSEQGHDFSVVELKRK